MTYEQAFEIAKKYAKRNNFDILWYAGNDSGGKYEYYYLQSKATLGHKIGLPHIIKLDGKSIEKIDDFSEVMMIRHRALELNRKCNLFE